MRNNMALEFRDWEGAPEAVPSQVSLQSAEFPLMMAAVSSLDETKELKRHLVIRQGTIKFKATLAISPLLDEKTGALESVRINGHWVHGREEDRQMP